MIGIDIIIGAVITTLVQLFKKIEKLGMNSNWIIILVFILCFIGAAVYQYVLGSGLITEEFLARLGRIVSSQYVVWGLFVKFIIPKLKGGK